jgi:hypothetical protein
MSDQGKWNGIERRQSNSRRDSDTDIEHVGVKIILVILGFIIAKFFTL